MAKHGENLAVLNVLKVAYFYLGKRDQAVGCGQRVLELHAAACWSAADGKLQLAPSSGRAGKNVISFSLWGNHATYNYEARLVGAWTESGRPFHAIRDHVLHSEPIMGQLWGGRADAASISWRSSRVLPAANMATTRPCWPSNCGQ